MRCSLNDCTFNVKQQYTNYFYGQIQENACNSAAAIVDFFLKHVQCQSVVDISCARGAWLNAIVDAGLSDVLGVDGEWVSLETLMIPREKFVRADLSKPLFLHRRFNVAICLEVGTPLSRCLISVLTIISMHSINSRSKHVQP